MKQKSERETSSTVKYLSTVISNMT